MARRDVSRSKLREYVELIVISVLLAVLIRTYVVCGYRIPSGSMEDTLLVGDHFLACRFLYRFSEPRIGDIIVFQYPLDTSRDFVKRIVAVEGQTVEIRDKVVYVDGEPVPAPVEGKHVDDRIYSDAISTRDNLTPRKVPREHVFVLGDNRDNSRDSRYWGFLNKRYIKGKAFLLYWSWKDMPNDPELRTLQDPVWKSLPWVFYSAVEVLTFQITNFPWRVRWDRVGRLIRA
jgi:signal peptidase I